MSTPIIIGIAGALTVVSVSAATALGLVCDSQRVTSVAESAAIAAAERLHWDADPNPCDAAQRVARANTVELIECHCESLDCRTTTRQLRLGLELIGTARAGADGDVFCQRCVW